MAIRGSRIAARLRRGLGLRRDREAMAEPRPDEGTAAGLGEAAVGAPARPSSPLAALRGLGERPTTGSTQPTDQAAEAELDTLRGELVRELDRLAEGDDGSGAFRRIAS
jgi:hypothetical protein